MARLPPTRLTPGDKVAGITDGESVYQLAGDDGPTVLVAIDGTTVQKRWRLAGIHTNCRMALTGDDGLVVVGEPTAHSPSTRSLRWWCWIVPPAIRSAGIRLVDRPFKIFGGRADSLGRRIVAMGDAEGGS